MVWKLIRPIFTAWPTKGGPFSFSLYGMQHCQPIKGWCSNYVLTVLSGIIIIILTESKAILQRVNYTKKSHNSETAPTITISCNIKVYKSQVFNICICSRTMTFLHEIALMTAAQNVCHSFPGAKEISHKQINRKPPSSSALIQRRWQRLTYKDLK